MSFEALCSEENVQRTFSIASVQFTAEGINIAGTMQFSIPYESRAFGYTSDKSFVS